MSDLATCRAVVFAGLPATELQLPCGDRLVVAQHGAHVLSWMAAGRERLYLSPKSIMDGQAAIRGGIPVCFPQFNMRGELPKHGFARHLPWTVSPARLGAEAVHLVLSLNDSAATRQWWPQAFEARLMVELQPGALQVELAVRNTDTKPLDFTGALHTYLAVDDIDLTDLQGLGLRPEWDAVADVHGVADAALYFDGEFDRVYDAAPQPLTLQDGSSTLQIEQSPSWGQSVVWNPGAEKCATLPDMPADGFAHMLCVEAAQVFEPISIPAGGHWVGWQRLTVS